MKMGLIVAALAATAVAVPATSSADSAQKSTARGGNDLSITFILESVGNNPKAVKDFKFKNFTVTCAVGGPVEVKGSIARMGVNDNGKFDGVAKKGDAKVLVDGEVKQNGNKVIGTLKSKGDFGGGAEDCRTKVNWEAT
jgi:hypothetical protein